ncbi:rRNA small subunit 7-methylguanosine (m7G) methyltransferase GidB [Labilithrix luteola]|uniref:Ribosomal RNA small subunit methyltransferase G n=1 Tax=Labilithrix luteola TaxID=1391654 RepID=A0A0K1PP42_9BACT|nr:16S rRNA (guanine(527)-N(7))-methyltransferase RsmG [Labilithrix luteola]AKU95288.1 rRNA small subunit 7-methylguanosine (m7G) methyltransferase GidB [Labilithrix luteola]
MTAPHRPPRPPLKAPPSVPLAPPAGFTDRLAEIGVSLDDATLAKLGDYLGRLLAMNEVMNLTAVRDAAEAWDRHLLDALTLVPLLAEVPAGGRVVDVGSGGGIPGIPLAIACPGIRFTLVESIKKKAGFLSTVSTALGLENVKVRAERAEQLDLRGVSDAVTARAVARLDELAPLVLPLIRKGGAAFLIKGQRADEELAEAAPVLERLSATHEKTISTPTGRIVVLRRVG